MTESLAAPADWQKIVERSENVIEGFRQPPVVIAEHAMAFGTAVAAALPLTKPTSRVIAALRAIFLSSSKDARPARPHHPPLLDFREHSTMAREMHRL